MTWYWIVLIIIGYIFIGMVVSALVYGYKDNNDGWDYVAFLVASLIWPVFVAYLPFYLIGKGAMAIAHWFFPYLKTID